MRERLGFVRGLGCALGACLLLASMGAGTARAQVPEDIYQAMLRIGQIVDPACTALLYRPFMPDNDYNSDASPLYPGINVARDVSFGSHPKDLVDIFSDAAGGANRPVVIYVPGGGGNKIEQQNREANAFYDNIGRWAVRNGMVAVLLQRHPGNTWDDPGRHVGQLVEWLQFNISGYGGDAGYMVGWAQSAGNGPLGTYIGRPELHTRSGVGLRGAILMAGGFNAAPLAGGGGGGRGGRGGPGGGDGPVAGATCNAGGPGASDGAIEGPSSALIDGAVAAGRGGGARAGGPGGGGQVDEATQMARSSLPELRRSDIKLFLVTPELDPGINGAMSTFYQALNDDLCAVGADRCPTMLFAERHNHMSVVFSPDSPDTSVTGPILEWIQGLD
jgi:hypothetical protein